MKLFFVLLLFCIISTINVTYGQQFVNKVQFFSDTSLVNATLTFNMGKLLSKKAKEGLIFPATFTCRMGDSLTVNDNISVEVRGHFRRNYCYIPPLKLIYKNNAKAAFYHLKTLKLVSACRTTNQYEQYLLKEFICYKIYNLISDKSFRVRLLNLKYQDSSGRKNAIIEHAFLMEDIKELAKRNGYIEWTGGKVYTEAANRRQTTMVSIFEYMIGNTDWSIPVTHNIRLIRPKNDSTSRAYAVPYDFDYCGLVNTDYAIPDENLGTENVRQRVYRGFPRTMEELNEILDIFKKQKANIYATINNFNLLTQKSKSEMTSYLDEFFTDINRPADVKGIFVNNARTQ
jgi:hypothetical protein